MRRRGMAWLAGAFFVSLGIAGKAQVSDDWRTMAPVEPEAARSRMSAFTGLTVIDGDPYWRLDLRPELRFGRLGVGLKAVLLVGAPSSDDPSAESETKILTEDGESWDTASAYLRSVRYVEWAAPRAPLYARFGELFDTRIGHGLLVEGYSNLDRRGVRLNVNQKAWGVETMLNNVNAPELAAGRIYVKPLASSESFVNRFTIGATSVVETNPFPDADDPKTKAPGVTDEDPLFGFALDVSYPVFTNESLLLELYNEMASVSMPSPVATVDPETKRGSATGIGLEVSTLRAKLEYRTFSEGFIPSLFGYDYEYLARTPGARGGGFDLSNGTTKGVYGNATLSLQEKAFVSAIFEDYNGSGPAGEPRLSARFTETDLLEPVDLRMFYSKRGIGGLDSKGEEQSFFGDLVDLDEKSLFVVELAYNVKGPLQVVLTREYRFREREDGNGYEPIKKTTAQLGFAGAF